MDTPACSGLVEGDSEGPIEHYSERPLRGVLENQNHTAPEIWVIKVGRGNEELALQRRYRHLEILPRPETLQNHAISK